MSEHIAPEVLEAWLTPYEALKPLLKVLNNETARHVIIEALRGGVLPAAAERASWKSEFGDPEIENLVLVDSVYWSHFKDKDSLALWMNGTATIELSAASHYVANDTVLRYFGVRFEPSAIDALTTSRPPKFEWLTPHDTIHRIRTRAQESSNLQNYVLERLRAGLIAAVAETASKLEELPPKKLSWYDIPAHHWDHLRAITFWESGSAQFRISTTNNFVGTSYEDWACFGIRFDPAGVDALIADLPKASTVESSRPDATGGTTLESKPGQSADKRPVSDADLRSWYELYCRVYGNQRPLTHAVESAQGMFPDKAVSRDKVRALFEPRKAGRKPKDASAE